MIRSSARRALPWVAALFIACCVVQVFLAGLGVFEAPDRFQVHAGFAFVFGWLTLVMLMLAIAARGGRSVTGLAAIVLVLFALQSVFVEVRTTAPAVAALHPVNGFAIIFVAILELRASMALARRPEEPTVAAPATAPLADGRAA